MILATLEQNVFFHIMHGVVSTRHGAKRRSHLIYFDILYLIFMKRRISEYFGGNILRIFSSLLIILCFDENLARLYWYIEYIDKMSVQYTRSYYVQAHSFHNGFKFHYPIRYNLSRGIWTLSHFQELCKFSKLTITNTSYLVVGDRSTNLKFFWYWIEKATMVPLF